MAESGFRERDSEASMSARKLLGALALAGAVLVGCGGGGGAGEPVPPTYSIGGSVSGLNGTVVLRNNGGNDLSLTVDGPFKFSTAAASGAPYAVTVLTQPAGQACSVASGTGTVQGANVTSVVVTCSNITYSVGGSVSGLRGTVVLQNNGGNDLSLTVDGPFSFSAAAVSGARYAVTVLTQPAGQACSVANGTGTVPGANVTGVAVTCSNITYSVGGSISGLRGTVVLQNNGGDDLPIATSGPFTFTGAMTDGSHYAVTVRALPAGLECSVTNGTGTISGANVAGVSIACRTGGLDTAFGTGGVVTGTPGGTGSSGATSVARDAGHLYVVGSDSGSGVMRVEKRNLGDGALVAGFGTGGVIHGVAGTGDVRAIAIDAASMYLAGSMNGECRIEKRSLADGALDPGFGAGGVATSPAGAYSACVHSGIAIDSTFLYAVGGDGPSFRIEKRNLSDGALVTGFGVGGVASSYSGTSQFATAIAIDASFLYVVGSSVAPPSNYE